MTTAFSGTELVEIAIQIEECGKAYYEEALKHLSNPEVREVFAYLRDEEEVHAATFEGLLSRLTDISAEWRANEDYVTYMRALAANRVFPDPAAVRAAVAGLADDAEAIRFALGFEKDTVLFFYEMRPMVGERDRPLVDDLIAEERKHIRRLTALLANLAGAVSS